MDGEPETKHCSNCLRDIAATNFVMHEVHCRRNIILCEKCEEPVPRSELDAHHLEVHACESCELCSAEIEKCEMEKHKSECPRRLHQCAYCELEMAFRDIAAHQDYCGSRTEPCLKCGNYVMVKDTNRHEDSNCSFPHANRLKQNNLPEESSRIQSNVSSRGSLPQLDYFNNFAMDELQRILDSEITTSTNTSNASVPVPAVQPANFYGSRRRNNNTTFQSNTTRRNHNGNTSAQGDSSGNLDRLLAMHLANDLSPDLNHFTADNNRDQSTDCDLTVLCELCGEPFPAELVFDHQDICAGPPTEPTLSNNLFPNSFQPPATLPDSFSNARSSDFRLPANHVALGCDSDEDDVLLPCEFCELTFPSEMLVQHQAVCDRNSTSTPLPPRSPANMRTHGSVTNPSTYLNRTRVPSTRKLHSTKNMSTNNNLPRATRRQQDPGLDSLLSGFEASGGATSSGANNAVISNDTVFNNLSTSSVNGARLGSGGARVSSSNTNTGQQAWTSHTTRPANFASNFPSSHASGVNQRTVVTDKNSNNEVSERRRGSAARVKHTLNHLVQNPTGNDSSDDFVRTTPKLHDKKSKSRLNQRTRDQQFGTASGPKQLVCDDVNVNSPEMDAKPRPVLSATRRRAADNADTYNASFTGAASRRPNKLRSVPKKNVEANIDSSLRVNNVTRPTESTSKSTKKPSKPRKPPTQGDS